MGSIPLHYRTSGRRFELCRLRYPARAVKRDAARAALSPEVMAERLRASVGDPLEDLGWLCLRAWRFGNVAHPPRAD